MNYLRLLVVACAIALGISNINAQLVKVALAWNTDLDGNGLLSLGGKNQCVSLAPTRDKCTLVKYQTEPDGFHYAERKIYGNFFEYHIYVVAGQYYFKLTSVHPEPPYDRTGAPEEVFPLFLYYARGAAISLRNLSTPVTRPPNYGFFTYEDFNTFSDLNNGVGTAMVLMSDSPYSIRGKCYVSGYMDGLCSIQVRPIILSSKGQTWFEEYWANLIL